MPDTSCVVNNYLVTKISVFFDRVVGSDFVALREDKGLLVIGDIVGHGICRAPGAVAAMGVFHAVCRSDHCHRCPYDGKKELIFNVLHKMNSVLYKIDNEVGGLAYIMSAQLIQDGTINMCGKFEEVQVLDEAYNVIGRLRTKGPVIGSKSQILPGEVPMSTVKLRKGQSVIVRTDGAVTQDPEDDQTRVMITYLGRNPRRPSEI